MNTEKGKHLSFPFRINSEGRTAQVSSMPEHVRDELLQLILTNPGERVFLPQFGGGARRLIFKNSDQASVAMVKAIMAQALSRWLGTRLSVIDLRVDVVNENINVYIKYQILGEEEPKVIKFRRKEESNE